MIAERYLQVQVNNLRFIREQDEYSLILDRHWRCVSHSAPELYVAGKDKGPNPQSLETLSYALNALETTLGELRASHTPREPGWHFTSIVVPYQFVKLYHLTFWSDYGVDLQYGIKIEDCQYGRQGIYPETNASTIASIPGDIAAMIRDINSADINDDELLELRHKIEHRELFGHELIPLLKRLLTRHGHRWHNGTNQHEALLEMESLLMKAN